MGCNNQLYDWFHQLDDCVNENCKSICNIEKKYNVTPFPEIQFDHVPLSIVEKPEIQFTISGRMGLILYNKPSNICKALKKLPDEDVTLYHNTMVKELEGYVEIVTYENLLLEHPELPSDLPSTFTVEMPIPIPPLMRPQNDLPIKVYEYFTPTVSLNPFEFTNDTGTEFPIVKSGTVVLGKSGLVSLIFESIGVDVPQGYIRSRKDVTIRWKL